MICDDDPGITYPLGIGLQRAGFVVDIFNTSSLALSKFEANTYALVILDEFMPDIDGIILYGLIKEKDSKAKVCFLTAYDDKVKKALPDLDPRFILRKPMTLGAIVALVEDIVHIGK